MRDETEGTLPEIPFYWDLTRRSQTRFRAHDIRHGRAVEIIVLDPTTLPAADVERLDEVIAGLADLDTHPAILPLIDHGSTDSGSRYLVWPAAEGPAMADADAGADAGAGSMGRSLAIGMGADLATGLAALHDRGVAHGDVQPGNVVLTDDGRAMLGAVALSASARPDEPTPLGLDVDGLPTPEDDVLGLAAVLTRSTDGLGADSDGDSASGPHGAGDPLAELIAAMTSAEPHDRPSMEAVARKLDQLRPEPKAKADTTDENAPRTVLAAEQPRVAAVPLPPEKTTPSRRWLLAVLTAAALAAAAIGFTALALINGGEPTEAAAPDDPAGEVDRLQSTAAQPELDNGEPTATGDDDPPSAPSTEDPAIPVGDTASSTSTANDSTTTPPTTTRRATTTTRSATEESSDGQTATSESATSQSANPRSTNSQSTINRATTTVRPTTERTTATTRRTTTAAPTTTRRTTTTAAPTTRRTTTIATPTTRRTTTTLAPTTQSVDCTWRQPSTFMSNFIMTARSAGALYSNTDLACGSDRSIAAGDRFRVIAEEPGWFYGQRERDGQYGWAPASNLTGCRPVGPDSYISNLTLTADRTTGLRARPQNGCILMNTVGAGQSVKVVAEQGSWYYGQLTSGGLWGWIPKSELGG